MAKGYTKFYLSQPVTIRETVSLMMEQQCSSVQQVTWREKEGKHYSPSVPTIFWMNREGIVFRFEMGAQWGDKRDILVDFGGRRGSSRNLSRSIGLVFLFMLHPKSAQTALPKATS